MTVVRRLCFSLVALAAAATPVFAQTGQKPKPPAPTPAKPARMGPTIGFRGYVNFDFVSMAAKDSFDAVLGTSTMSGIGGGGEVLRIWKGLFGRLGVSSMSDTGSRVAIVNGQVIPLDIPIEVSLRTLEIGAGWRHEIRPRPRAGAKPPTKPPAKPPAKPAAPPAGPVPPRFAVYGGAALLQVAYREESDFAETGETGRASVSGYSVFGGAEVTIWKWIFAGAEGQYRSIENALGEGGVSLVYGETNLGGAVFRVMFGVRR